VNAMTNFPLCSIGQAVMGPQAQTIGYVYSIEENPAKQYQLSQNMAQIMYRIGVVYPDAEHPYMNELSEHDIPRATERARGADAVTPETVAAFVQQVRDFIADDRATREREANEKRERVAAWRAEHTPKIPKGAKAVIIAEYREDESDSQSDYHASSVGRVLILGFSTHTRKAALAAPETQHLADAPESAEHREKYSMGGGYYLKDGYRHSTGWAIRKYTLGELPYGEWRVSEMTKGAPARVIGGVVLEASHAGALITEHMHTKGNFPMWIVQLSQRVERDVFDDLRRTCEGLGGWYSRAWGSSPAGFAFKSKEVAEQFAAGLGANEPPPTGTDAATRTRNELAQHAARFRKMADTLRPRAERALAPRLDNTPKRLKQAMTARLAGLCLERACAVLDRLAIMAEAGSLSPQFANLHSAKEIEEHMRAAVTYAENGYHAYYVEAVPLRPARLDNTLTAALWALLNQDPEKEKRERLYHARAELKGCNIPGYFPTPPAVVARMIEAAQLRITHTILEPSAGHGAIATALPSECLTVVYELSPRLCEVLQLHGFDARPSDFLSVVPRPFFDRVLMNPPFENLADIDHVRHAFEFLKPGGRLVAIMSPAFSYRRDKKAEAFRDWAVDLMTHSEKLPAGTFRESGTDIESVLIVLDKPER
jgi:protein-L-isoaspartate O-methyltransferase